MHSPSCIQITRLLLREEEEVIDVRHSSKLTGNGRDIRNQLPSGAVHNNRVFGFQVRNQSFVTCLYVLADINSDDVLFSRVFLSHDLDV